MKFEEYLNSLQRKTVAVIGIGVSNQPLIQLLAGRGIAVTACDKKERAALGATADELESRGVTLRLGADYLKDPSAKIPTIVPAKNRALRGMESAGAPVKPEEYADKSRLVEYGRCGAGWLAIANTYRDRDAVNGIKVQARKTISDVFDDF